MGTDLVNQRSNSPVIWIVLLVMLATSIWAFQPIKKAVLPMIQPTVLKETAVESATPPRWSEAELREVMAKQLRKPRLIKPVAVVLPDPPKSAPDPPKITLIATMIGNGDASAVVRDPKGVVARIVVGDHLAGAVVQVIRPGEMDIEYDGILITLSVKSSSREQGRHGG